MIEYMLIELSNTSTTMPRPVNSDNSVCGVDEEGLAPPGKLDALDRRRRADLFYKRIISLNDGAMN